MSLSDRDRKIVMVAVPLVFLLGYWFLALAPKRNEAKVAGEELVKQEKKRDQAVSQAARLDAAKASFTRDYRDVVRLGKAIPSTVDMPSLIVQLDQAARGTGIKFTKIKAGDRSLTADAAGAAPASGGSKSGSGAGGGSAPASGGSQPTQSKPGQASQTANNATADANQKTAEKSGAAAGDTQTSTSSKSGGLPVGGGAAPAGGKGGSSSTAPGLDSVPLEFKFDGSFFDLADFFHRLKRFVRVTNEDVRVRGRLMTIDGMKFAAAESSFPDLTVEVMATVYLSPKSEGTTAGASPQGPAPTQTAAASSEGSPASSKPPIATGTP